MRDVALDVPCVRLFPFGTEVACSLGDLGPGESVTKRVTFQFRQPGQQKNQAQVSSENGGAAAASADVLVLPL